MPTFLTSQPDSAADPSLPHVVLVGLPGSGKSTVGALLGKQQLDALAKRPHFRTADLIDTTASDVALDGGGHQRSAGSSPSAMVPSRSKTT